MTAKYLTKPNLNLIVDFIYLNEESEAIVFEALSIIYMVLNKSTDLRIVIPVVEKEEFQLKLIQIAFSIQKKSSVEAVKLIGSINNKFEKNFPEKFLRKVIFTIFY